MLDRCMMQSAEIATALIGEVGYVLASPTVRFSRNYEPLTYHQLGLNWLVQHPTADLWDLASHVLANDRTGGWVVPSEGGEFAGAVLVPTWQNPRHPCDVTGEGVCGTVGCGVPPRPGHRRPGTSASRTRTAIRPLPTSPGS